MAKYEGETIRIKVTATDFDETAITGDAATPPTGTIELYDSAGELYLSGDLEWDATSEYWFYDWDTTTGDAGTYRVRARFVGATYDTWEFGRLQLKSNPVTLS